MVTDESVQINRNKQLLFTKLYMKTLFLTTALFFYFSIISFSQEPFARPNLQNCEKKAQKEFFKLKKDGWMQEDDAGFDLKAALTKFYLLQEELDSKKKQNYFFADGSSISSTKTGGYLESTDKAKLALADKLISAIDSALNSKLQSKMATEIEKAQAHKMVIDLKEGIAKKISKANVAIKLFRTSETNSLVPESQTETMVKIYQDKKYLYELGAAEAIKIFKNKFDFSEDDLNGLFKY